MSVREKLAQNYPYALNPDHEQGFADAVHNNQLNLAMYYMIELFADLQEDVADIKSSQTEARKITAKKTSKKTAAKLDEE